MNKKMVCDADTIVALRDGTYKGLWNGFTVVVPFEDYPSTEFNYEITTPELCPKLVTCDVIVKDYDALIKETSGQKYKGEIHDGKFVFIDL